MRDGASLRCKDDLRDVDRRVGECFYPAVEIAPQRAITPVFAALHICKGRTILQFLVDEVQNPFQSVAVDRRERGAAIADRPELPFRLEKIERHAGDREKIPRIERPVPDQDGAICQHRRRADRGGRPVEDQEIHVAPRLSLRRDLDRRFVGKDPVAFDLQGAPGGAIDRDIDIRVVAEAPRRRRAEENGKGDVRERLQCVRQAVHRMILPRVTQIVYGCDAGPVRFELQ